MPLFQAFLTKIWWGNMVTGTSILWLLGAFTCPALIYTNLITFRWVREAEASARASLGPQVLHLCVHLGTSALVLSGPNTFFASWAESVPVLRSLSVPVPQ
jgi:hypothetical protein